MKKRRCAAILAASLLLNLVLAACGGDTGEASPSPTPSETPAVSETPEPTPTPEPFRTPEHVNPLTGEEMAEELISKKPVAVMLNNLKAAMPQQGNSQADIIYEVLAEGGITRMLALYQDISDVPVIGSVRSARLYYFELALGHDAVYVHAGGSPGFYDAKSAWGVTTVDGVRGYYAGANVLFWRDKNRVAGHSYGYEHSLVTSGEKMVSLLTQREVLTDHPEGWAYTMAFAEDGAPKGGQPAGTVTVPFSRYKTGVFRYDGDKGLYLVEEYGEPYIDGNDGSQVAVTNLIILETSCKVIPGDKEGRLDVKLSGGEGYYACGGSMVPILWTKGDRDDQLKYYAENGAPLTLGVGKSYVCIVPEGCDVTVE